MELPTNIMDATFIGLMTIGIVNVVTFYKPELPSKERFAISIVAAFLLTFVPAEMGNIILEKAKVALGVAFAASGGFKLASKAGGQ